MELERLHKIIRLSIFYLMIAITFYMLYAWSPCIADSMECCPCNEWHYAFFDMAKPNTSANITLNATDWRQNQWGWFQSNCSVYIRPE